MAIRRLWIIGLLLFGTSCILAPDIDIDEPELNYPPEIVFESIKPPDDGALVLDSDPICWPAEFEIGLVRERNVRNILSVAWFLDWNRSDVEKQPSWVFIQPSGDTTRIGPKSTVDLIEVDDGEVHSVRVFIADTDGAVLDYESILKFPEGSDGLFDSYQWTFTLAPAGEGYCVESGTE